MKRFFSSLAVLAMLCICVSCSKDVDSGDRLENYSETDCELRLFFPNVEFGTRVGLESGDNMVSDIQVMVFNSKDKLETSAKIFDGISTTLRVTAGTKVVYVVANCDTDLTGVTSAAEILRTPTQLSKNTVGGAFVMFGSKADVIVSGSTDCKIDLRKIASKVELGTITVKFASSGNATLADKDFNVDRIYIQNAVVNARLGEDLPLLESDFVNKGKYLSGSFDPYISETYPVPRSIHDNGRASNVCASKYYVCPNRSAVSPFGVTDDAFHVCSSELVIEATVNGHKTYYPINLGPMESNKKYVISNVDITGYGVDNPGEDATKYGLACIMKVIDWEPGKDDYNPSF